MFNRRLFTFVFINKENSKYMKFLNINCLKMLEKLTYLVFSHKKRLFCLEINNLTAEIVECNIIDIGFTIEHKKTRFRRLKPGKM